ncbi:OmpA family protein [Tenacibaculum maritimum]|uniref:OmpA family protein n=1 Tax=Tenacibaculum maritimum TaxID=107401 RepID=UPI001E64A022|nr:OmpA family protein [Tenacibaculum maritimum]MCD9609474.1 OmpA family protein [Tenacibaculum maritimum]
MKQIKLAVIALFALATVSSVNAQDSDNPWVVGFGVNTVDVRTYSDDAGDILKDYVGTTEWGDNTLPSISRITVDKYLDSGFSLQLAGSLNKVKTVLRENDADALYYSIDAIVKYDLNNLVGQTGWFDPYVALGGGYQSIDSEGDGVLIGAAGFNTWFNDNLGLNFQSGYKHGFEDTGRDVFQHSIGLVFKFGGKDTDGDGIYDKEDACPEVAGLKEFNGCPDADKDGVKDSEDACPEVAGLAALNGCPDTDGDGIADKDDACPNAKGTKAMNGCPDADKDGIADNKDKCPQEAGPAENGGCPWGDADKDGVLDNVDKCPKVAGVASNNGCPVVEVITEEATKKLNDFARAIYFNSGRNSFRPGVKGKLDLIATIMKEYPDANFSIQGHTDSQGPAASNQRLSDKRAKAVLDYLTGKGGISSSRLSSVGFGEEYPIASNKTRAGRAENRRVEIKLVKKK